MSILSISQNPVRANPPHSDASWQEVMKHAVRDPAELARLLRLPPEYAAAAAAAARQFSVFVPRGFIAKMKPGDPDDPLLRQVLPLGDELAVVSGFSRDPVADGSATRLPGLLQKYPGRVLLVASGVCAVHCRYCFRRHFPYSDTPHSFEAWHGALSRVASDTSIREVILSGGDPLTLVDDQLAELTGHLAAIPHLERLRIHTRLPVMIPERVTDQLLACLRETRLTTLLVIHANHPAELDEAVCRSLAKVTDAGIPVLNQAVLLRGVNDRVETLETLCRLLANQRVLPYYLHQLDRVSGAAHFEVPLSRGLELVAELRQRLPGYAVPRYVQEQPGQASKVTLN